MGAVKLLPCFASSSNIVTTFRKKLLILKPPSAACNRQNLTLSFMMTRIDNDDGLT
jgi:hypothetical protein